MIDIEELKKELFGPWDVQFDDQGEPLCWTYLRPGSDKYSDAMQTMVLAQLSNAVEKLNERLA